MLAVICIIKINLLLFQNFYLIFIPLNGTIFGINRKGCWGKSYRLSQGVGMGKACSVVTQFNELHKCIKQLTHKHQSPLHKTK